MDKVIFETKKQKRHTMETLDSLLQPLMNHLTEDTKECVRLGLWILRNVDVEKDE